MLIICLDSQIVLTVLFCANYAHDIPNKSSEIRNAFAWMLEAMIYDGDTLHEWILFRRRRFLMQSVYFIHSWNLKILPI